MGPIVFKTPLNLIKSLKEIRLLNQTILQIRDYLVSCGLIEVFTPTLVNSGAIEPYLDCFGVDNYYLPTSPEFSLKKSLLIYHKETGIFEIAHSFRKEELSSAHSHEFFMAEWYKRETFYLDLMGDLKTIIERCGANSSEIFELSVHQLFKNIYNMDLFSDSNLDDYIKFSNSVFNKIEKPGEYTPVNESSSVDKMSEIFTLLLDNALARFFEQQNSLKRDYGKKIVLFLYDYPSFARGMAKLNPDGWAMRIEMFINGLEIASGYQELDNENELKELWTLNNSVRQKNQKTIHPVDDMVLHSASQMKGISGMALGIDRLVMALYDIDSISLFRNYYLVR